MKSHRQQKPYFFQCPSHAIKFTFTVSLTNNEAIRKKKIPKKNQLRHKMCVCVCVFLSLSFFFVFFVFVALIVYIFQQYVRPQLIFISRCQFITRSSTFTISFLALRLFLSTPIVNCDVKILFQLQITNNTFVETSSVCA